MHEPVVVQATHLQHLLDALKDRGYQVVGPTVADGAIVYASIDTVSDLPTGALSTWWQHLGVSPPEIVRTFRGFNAYAAPFRQEGDAHAPE
jgi:hypothetical protein